MTEPALDCGYLSFSPELQAACEADYCRVCGNPKGPDCETAEFYEDPANREPVGPPRRRHGRTRIEIVADHLGRTMTPPVRKPLWTEDGPQPRWGCRTAEEYEDALWAKHLRYEHVDWLARVLAAHLAPAEWDAQEIIDVAYDEEADEVKVHFEGQTDSWSIALPGVKPTARIRQRPTEPEGETDDD